MAGGTSLERLYFLIRMQDQVSRPIGAITGRLRKMNNTINKAAGNLTTGFITATAAVAGLAGTLGFPIVAAADFESKMAAVQAVTQAGAKEMDAMTKTARTLGATTSFAATEAAQGMKYLGLAGFKATQIIAAMPGVLDMAKAGTLDLGRAANIGSNILSGFNLEAAQMGRVGDVLTKTFTSSNSTLEQLGDTMKFVGPVASAVGESLETMAGAAGLLGDVGIVGSQAGTALRAMLLRLSAPTGEAARQLRALGVETRDAAGNFAGMVPLLEKLAATTAGMGNAARLGAFKQIFGEEAAAASVELVKQAGAGGLQHFIDQLENARGTANRVATDLSKNFKGKLLGLKSAWESLNITIGSYFLPMLGILVESIKGGVRTFDAWADRFPNITKLIGFATAGLFGLMLALGVLKITMAAISLAMLPFNAGFRVMRFLIGPAWWLVSKAAMLAWRGAMLLVKGAAFLYLDAMHLINGVLGRAAWVVSRTAILAWRGALLLAKGTMMALRGAAILFNLALMGPWLAVAVLVGVAVAAIIVNWEKVKGWFTGFWDWLVSGFNSVAEKLAGILSGPLDFFRSIGRLIGISAPAETSAAKIAGVQPADSPAAKTIVPRIPLPRPETVPGAAQAIRNAAESPVGGGGRTYIANIKTERVDAGGVERIFALGELGF